MELLAVAAVIAVLYLVIRYIVGIAVPPILDRLVWAVVVVLVIAWLLCFLGVWCARGGVR
jgi:hypothetical protein